MKKNFYLTMTLLLTLAVGTSYADEDPSVVTLFEYSFAEGMGEFTSLTSSADWGVENTAWHYNEELHCVEYSGTESGTLISPLIAELANEKYYDIQLIYDYAGENVESSNFTLYLINSRSYIYNETQDLLMPSSKDDFYTNSSITLNKYCHGKESKIAFAITNRNADNNKCFRIKNLKVIARDWTKVENVQRVSDVNEICSLPNNTPVIITYKDTQPSWCENDCVFLSNGQNAYMVSFQSANCFIDTNDKFSGEAYGYIVKDDGFTYLQNSSFHFTSYSYSVGNVTWNNPNEISMYEIGSHVGKLVKLRLQQPIAIYDKIKGSGTYTPNYPTVFQGVVMKNDAGDYLFWIIRHNSLEITLPEDLPEVPQFSDNEIGCWVKTGRTIEQEKWYSICLPFDFSASYPSHCLIATLTTAEDGMLGFTTGATSLQMGQPALIKFTNYPDEIRIEGGISSPYNVTPKTVSAGDYNMVGTLSQVTPITDCYYLTAGNTIKPLAAGGKINAFRAYFEPNTVAAARTRSISIDGTVIATGDGSTTDIEDILNGRTNDMNGEVYNLNGQRVTNSTQKGIFIINGKKVIK